MKKEKIQPWKVAAFKNVENWITRYPVIAAADLRKMRSPQIHELRKKLRGQVEMAVIKKTITRKAAEKLQSQRVNIVNFVDSLTMAPILLFTEMDPFSLVLLLNRNKIRVPAKGGDIASGDIIIPAGNTGIPPGPIIGEFGEVKVPTKIESGSIWVAKDTIVARKGDSISPKLASVLSKLGIKPMELGLSLVAAYDDGTIFEEKDLKLDLGEYRANFRQAASEAFNLAVNSSYMLPETAPQILGKSYRQALSLAIRAEYPAEETISQIIRDAYVQMLGLSSKVGLPAETSPNAKPQEAKTEEKIEKKEKT